MDTSIYFLVKLCVVAYTLYKTWSLLSGEMIQNVCRKIFSIKKTKDNCLSETTDKQTDDVIGKTQLIYLPELPTYVMPVMSQKLNQSGYIGTEEELSSEEVAVALTSIPPDAIPDEDELFESSDDNGGMDPDFATGLTYEKLANAVSVLMAKSIDDDTSVIEAAQTIYSVRDTDLFQFLTTQVSNSKMVENLLSNCLDENGTPLQRHNNRSKVNAFNWDKFV